jgi:hypothetical protein
MTSSGFLWLVALAVGGAACTIHHEVQLQEKDAAWHYSVESQKHDAGLVAVIDGDTLERVTSIRSLMAGGANAWDARPGRMLRQVADIELPQMFQHYAAARTYEEPSEGDPRFTLVLTVMSYAFADMHASLTVHGSTYGRGKQLLFERDYQGTGKRQAGKVFWGGAFAMKSAIRQSTLDAYQQVLAEIRADLDHAIRSPGAPAETPPA